MKIAHVVWPAAIAILGACGGASTPTPAGTQGNDDASTDASTDVPSGPAPCDGMCTISFASGAEWAAYDDDPATNPAAVKLGMAQPVCITAKSPPNCPPGALIYGFGEGWSFSLLTVPNAVWIWGPGIAPTDVSDLKRFVFTNTFMLGAGPAGRISIAADDAAEVRVNGMALASIGSVTDISEAAIANSRLTNFDLTPLLVTGPNTITIAAQNGPPSYAGCAGSCTYAQNPAGTVFGGKLTYH